ncbi:hypothetical protein BJ138DRAFT_1104366 [Hygrophoropsis aurantiaca]|uniref:Uncharacterized protein n=1 Tax=Hygrophoropsis aurantiaca TaxID=72124 RepID=A0ACB8A1R6_9AGAM|nr:hypothetical protein BJ138DRAFT_1104366 [Hygrophoropsis aurantiaca]
MYERVTWVHRVHSCWNFMRLPIARYIGIVWKQYDVEYTLQAIPKSALQDMQAAGLPALSKTYEFSSNSFSADHGSSSGAPVNRGLREAESFVNWGFWGYAAAWTSTVISVTDIMASDNLWEELDDFRPVALGLPDHFWVHYIPTCIGLTDEAWDILTKYTARVRTLDCCLDSTVSEEELEAFTGKAAYSNIFHRRPLFPSLKTLRWRDDNPGFFPHSYLAGPSLVNLRMTFTHRSSLIPEIFLESLGYNFPNLKNLQMNGLNWKEGGPEALWDSLPHLRRLEVFKCDSLDITEYEWLFLGELPNLTEIDVYLSDFVLQELKSSTDTHGPRLFTSLRNIGLAVDDLQSASEFLEHFQISPVSLNIRLHQHAAMETTACAHPAYHARAETTFPWQLFAVTYAGVGTGHVPVFRSVVAPSAELLKQGSRMSPIEYTNHLIFYPLVAVEMVSSVGQTLSPVITGTVLTIAIAMLPQLVLYMYVVNQVFVILNTFILFFIKDSDRYKTSDY